MFGAGGFSMVQLGAVRSVPAFMMRLRCCCFCCSIWREVIIGGGGEGEGEGAVLRSERNSGSGRVVFRMFSLQNDFGPVAFGKRRAVAAGMMPPAVGWCFGGVGCGVGTCVGTAPWLGVELAAAAAASAGWIASLRPSVLWA